jgi:Skp family chaperone for outer membrane proteins
MPCRVDGYDNMSSGAVSYDDYHKLKAEADKATRILCSVLRELEEIDVVLNQDPERTEWWEAHKAWDALRIQQEAEQAKKALTAAKKDLKAKEKLLKAAQAEVKALTKRLQK